MAVPIAAEIDVVWSGAPVEEEGAGGRWVRFASAEGKAIYLQRYAWDDETLAQFLVVWPDERDGMAQERYITLAEALGAVQALCSHAA